MRRREFITLLGGAAVAWPRAAWAQQAPRVRTVGVILPYPQNDAQSQARAKAFSFGLQQAGWIEGQNLRTEFRSEATEPERIRVHSADLVRLQADVILANSTPVVSALPRN